MSNGTAKHSWSCGVGVASGAVLPRTGAARVKKRRSLRANAAWVKTEHGRGLQTLLNCNTLLRQVGHAAGRWTPRSSGRPSDGRPSQARIHSRDAVLASSLSSAYRVLLAQWLALWPCPAALFTACPILFVTTRSDPRSASPDPAWRQPGPDARPAGPRCPSACQTCAAASG